MRKLESPAGRQTDFILDFFSEAKSFSLLKLLVNDNRRTDVWNQIQPLFDRTLRNVLLGKWKLKEANLKRKLLSQNMTWITSIGYLWSEIVTMMMLHSLMMHSLTVWPVCLLLERTHPPNLPNPASLSRLHLLFTCFHSRFQGEGCPCPRHFIGVRGCSHITSATADHYWRG